MTADPFSKPPPFADDVVQGEDAPNSDPLGDPPPYESIVMSSPNSVRRVEMAAVVAYADAAFCLNSADGRCV